MRWLADECVAAALVSRLRQAGHDVIYTAETDAGAIDEEVVGRAQEEGRLLLTDDKDFGELVFRRGHLAPGLVLLRIESESPLLKWQRLSAAIEHFGEALLGRFTVVEETRMRSRRLSGS